MGASQSSDLPSMDSFCSKLAIASKKCMNEHDFDREKYRSACVQQFRDYRDCKQRWHDLKRQILSEGASAAQAPPQADK
ncbi:hypothetical protein BC831DRAFT_450477 [Entophlyctis helioformis]|nr:hypothetical protein BC831DRAFT_450477 [Entophlyctis helioformis]